MLRRLSPILPAILFFTVLLPIVFVKVAISSHMVVTIFFVAFAVCYMLTLLFGILDLVAKIAGDLKSDAFQKSIFKVVENSPFLLPTVLFALLIFIATPVLSLNRIGYLLYFSLFLLLCLLLYFAEVHLVRTRLERHLRAMDQAENETRLRSEIDLSRKSALGSGKRLLLVNPVNPGSQQGKFQPLSLSIVAALTPDDFHVKLIDETTEAFQYQDADLVAITGFTASAYRAYEIGAQYRRNGIPVVMGGIHASMMADEASEYVDSVVIGEAEAVWRDVIVDFLHGNLKKRYQGVPVDLRNMVKPKREIFSKQYPWVSVQTSRGCPMDCDFCSVTAFNGREYRVRPIEEVLDELESISSRDIFFVDDNLIGYGRNSTERAKDLFKGMIERNLNKRWACQAAVNFGADDELLSLAQESGCFAVLIGFESDDPNDLLDMNKKLNLRFQYKELLKNFNKHRMFVYGAFIFGTERETRQSMWRKTRFICRNRIDVIQATTMTPLPGTRLFEKASQEGRLIYTDFPRDWQRYHMWEYTYQIKGLEKEEFAGIMKKCMNRIFSKWTMSKKLLKATIYTKRPLEGIGAYVVNSRFGEWWDKSFRL
jgi:radical SAM superfamily enzyme YgiQ (UPF0313 family)